MANLSDLTKLSKQLNEESNQVNQVLQNFEQKLNDMNLGVEAWLNPGAHNLPALRSRPYEDNGQFLEEIEVLGFGRFGQRYALLFKTQCWKRRGDGQDPEWDLVSEGPARPLLQASRELRIRALDQLETLLGEIKIQGEKILEQIDKGRKIVDNLIDKATVVKQIEKPIPLIEDSEGEANTRISSGKFPVELWARIRALRAKRFLVHKKLAAGDPTHSVKWESLETVVHMLVQTGLDVLERQHMKEGAP